MDQGKQAEGMWKTLDGKDVSAESLPQFDWQKDGFHMQQTIVDVVRGIDDGNDPGYVPEAESRLNRWVNRDFDDDGVDPSMVSERSDNLNDRIGEFWQNGRDEHPQKHQNVQRGTKASGAREHGIPWKTIRRICAGFAVAFAFLCLMRFVVFDIDEVRVEGNSTVSTDEILRLSGIRTGMNILTLDENAITRKIDSNRYLKLEAIEKKTNHLVILHVRESQESSFIRYCGILYTLDVRGMVLNEWIPQNGAFLDGQDEEREVPDLLQVEGLDIKNCYVGRKIILNDERQMPIYKEFVMELKAMSMENRVKILYLTDPDSIYLGTESGFSVRMGNSERLHAKLRSLQLVLDKLEQESYPEGTIDVSTPEVPTYIPSSSL